MIYIIRMSLYHLIGNRVKAVFLILIYMFNIILLSCTVAFNTSVKDLIDTNFNSDTGINDYRSFFVELEDEGSIEQIERMEYIQNIMKASTNSSEKILVEVTVDDYKDVSKVVSKLDKQMNLNVIVDEQKYKDIGIMYFIEFMEYVIISIITAITLSVFIIAQSINLKTKRIKVGVLKAVGYREIHLFSIFFVEEMDCQQ